MENARTFTVRLQDLLRRVRSALAEFIVELAEFDARRLWVDLGHASLFAFLHRELGLSKGAAYYRVTAAELVQKFPEVIEPLRDGRLCFTTVVELARVLTPENRSEVLPRFFLLSRREAKVVSVEIRPVEAPPRRDVVTGSRAAPTTQGFAPALPGARPDHRQERVQLDEPARDLRHVAAQPDEPVHANAAFGAAGSVAHGNAKDVSLRAAPPARPAPLPAPTRSPVASSEPLTADLSRLHFTVSRRFLEKLEAARAALSHSHPGAGMEEILEAGLDLVLERHARRKGIVKKPQREPRPSKPGRVPAHVLRAVWKRDGGRCQWRLASGGICGSTLRVEVDHRVSRARGGPPTVENLHCLCRFHNDAAARQVFGDVWMDRYTRRPGAGAASVNAPPATPP